MRVVPSITAAPNEPVDEADTSPTTSNSFAGSFSPIPTLPATKFAVNVPAPISVAPNEPVVRDEPVIFAVDNIILLPAIVILVPSPSIFSPSSPKVRPILDGMFTSASAVRLISPPAKVRLVPSPSIFSPSLPKVIPILAGILISPLEPTLILKSVPSLSIYSPLSWWSLNTNLSPTKT